MMTITLPIELTGLETVFLCDGILNKDVAEGLEDPKAIVPIARQTLLLLGSAYREVVSKTEGIRGNVTLQVTEEMAWLMRSKVRTGDVDIGGQNIGVGLLLKLYELLGAFQANVAELAFIGDVEEKELTEYDKQYLGYVKRETNARRNGPDSNSNQDSYSGT